MNFYDGENMSEYIYDVLEIRQILLHRYPFLMVDRLISSDENGCVAIKNVTANEPHFTGHFPELPIMPGVLQVEALAQTAGLYVYYQNCGKDFSKAPVTAFLTSVDGFKFKRKVVPGDTLTLKVSIKSSKFGTFKFDAKAYVDDELSCSGEVALFIPDLNKKD